MLKAIKSNQERIIVIPQQETLFNLGCHFIDWAQAQLSSKYMADKKL